MPRTFYAIEYAYGRGVVNKGNRADYIHQFYTVGERKRFVDQMDREGKDADVLPATHPDVRKAKRYEAQGAQWPIAV